MSSFTRRLPVTAVTAVLASSTLLAAATPASVKCVHPHSEHVGPLHVYGSSENSDRFDVCGKIDFGTHWEGTGIHTGQFGLFNVKYADNKFFVVTIDDAGLGSSNQNPTGTFG
ncbi:hypothetical protein N24_1962 [Corynebacterium suranareeae]|uniref:Secreted protein n=1 Tax=Corynebacterium suranareeae TaxID=2506452 RepID=A0A160PRI1_9CORY|nr:hypothetical protein [Corynebacterium suranareeae]BAU96224.1 hypothetical protein N24_1962 [Corynebacterium suranareeae]